MLVGSAGKIGRHLAQEALAFFGEREAARAALEEAHAGDRLEPRDVAAHAGRSQAEHARRRGEAAVLGGAHEGDEELDRRHRPILKRRLKLIASRRGW